MEYQVLASNEPVFVQTDEYDPSDAAEVERIMKREGRDVSGPDGLSDWEAEQYAAVGFPTGYLHGGN